MDEKIDILLSRYFSGEASPEELNQLDIWLAKSAENEAYFDQMTILYQQSALVAPMEEPDIVEALADFKSYMQKVGVESVKKSFKISPFYRSVAAVAILLVGLGMFFLLRNNSSQPDPILAGMDAEEYVLFENIDVLLEPESEIRFLSRDENKVSLRGKATFSVNSTNEKQLLVKAGETYIKDIGTVFTVTAYDMEESVIVEVTEGEVLFFTEDNEGITIRQYETAVYNPHTGQFSYIKMQETLEEIIFNATPLSEVVNLLEVRYGVQILIKSSDLKKMQISVSFDKNESIDNILEIITETLSIHASKENDSFVISW